MRWSGQLVEVEQQGRLPGISGATVRTFDAPEALNTRFHEIHTKSALNRVPEMSRVPFRWTVNPYRGCSHRCVYCTSGETPILMGDGTTRLMADLRAGDVVYGTTFDGKYRRYTRSVVKDHWSVVKPAYRVVLADGTELVSSGDHRYLTNRGWKYVTGAMGGLDRRPYLTANNELLGVGGFARPPVEGDDYRRGYLTGMIRGDATIRNGVYEKLDGAGSYTRYQFRLALADDEGLVRTASYLDHIGLTATHRRFSAATGTRRELNAINVSTRAGVEHILDQIAWPLSPSDEWAKGFLAGIFDAEGSRSGGVLRIFNADPMILSWTDACLRRFGFDSVVEPARPNGVRSVRIRGGLKEHLWFFHLTNPAILRKRDIEGSAIKSDADLRVEAIEPLGHSMRLFDITTQTGDFIANGVVSHNCFARPTHEYLDMNAAEDFDREIVVKVNVPEVLRAELSKPSWKGEHVALGTNTDPYQWVEGRYRLMRGIWEALRDARNPCSILTKSPLVLRDLDLLLEIAEVAQVSACLSVPTLDEKAWRETEPGTPHPRKRLEAVRKLNEAGIPTGILISPLLPGINDHPDQIAEVIELAKEAGAVTIGGHTLFLRGSVREIYFGWLHQHRPDLVALYERLYAKGAYAPREERERIEKPVRLGRVRAVRPRFQRGFDAVPGLDDPAVLRREAALRGAKPPPKAPVQEALF